MARPKKEPELVTTHRVTIRFNDTQYEVLAENARIAGIPLADYIRKSLANNGFVYEYKIVREDKEIHDLTAALSRIGNNPNQLVRYFHQSGTSTTGIENDIRGCIREVYDMSAKLDDIETADNCDL